MEACAGQLPIIYNPLADSSLQPPHHHLAPSNAGNRMTMSSKCKTCNCNNPNCRPIPKIRYVQPPRTESCKPKIEYQYPVVRIDDDTIYKNSYQSLNSSVAKTCRPEPIKPANQLQFNLAKMDRDTVTGLSFPMYCSYSKRKPILPRQSTLLGSGQMQSLTTQKHDFVDKFIRPPAMILPKGCIERPQGSLEKETIQKLSFPIPCFVEPVRSCKPVRHYQKPIVRMESDTTNKLSFLPYCLPKKEAMPWASRGSFQKPTIPLEKETTYKLSFIPNPGDFRPKLKSPCSTLSTDRAVGFDGRTVYKESFFGYQPTGRTRPIMPTAQLSLPTTCSQDPDTVYKLSFPIYCKYQREPMIMPRPPKLMGEGPMQSLTTQKHDFVSKPIHVEPPIRPRDLIGRPSCPLESETTQKLSFQTNKIVPTISCKPIRTYKKPEIPVEKDTIQKLSFLPQCPAPKDRMPWAEKPKYRAPTIPMEVETTQRLSFLPPGQVIDENCCSCQLEARCSEPSNVPRAAIC